MRKHLRVKLRPHKQNRLLPPVGVGQRWHRRRRGRGRAQPSMGWMPSPPPPCSLRTSAHARRKRTIFFVSPLPSGRMMTMITWENEAGEGIFPLPLPTQGRLLYVRRYLRQKERERPSSSRADAKNKKESHSEFLTVWIYLPRAMKERCKGEEPAQAKPQKNEGGTKKKEVTRGPPCPFPVPYRNGRSGGGCHPQT